MKLLDNYISDKKLHSSFFRKYSAKERLSQSEQIISLKTSIDLAEAKIVQAIMNYALDYDMCVEKLAEHNLEAFLLKNSQLVEFLKLQKIYETAHYDENEELEKLIGFETLCKSVWEDYLITEDERIALDNYCKENGIDAVQQRDIEQDVLSKINVKNLDLEEIIGYYLIEETKQSKEILWILEHEYGLNVAESKLNELIEKLDRKKSERLNLNKVDLVKTLDLEDLNEVVYIVKCHHEPKSGFDITFFDHPEYNDRFKILIEAKIIDSSSDERIIDIITDAYLYKTFDRKEGNSILKFLQLKPTVRGYIEKSYYRE